MFKSSSLFFVLVFCYLAEGAYVHWSSPTLDSSWSVDKVSGVTNWPIDNDQSILTASDTNWQVDNVKHFTVRDNVVYGCNGELSGTTRQCSGKLVPAKPYHLEQLCNGQYNGFYKNHYCLSTGPAMFTYNLGQLSCTSLQGRPTLLLTKYEHGKICGRYTRKTTVQVDNGNDWSSSSSSSSSVSSWQEANAKFYTVRNGVVYGCNGEISRTSNVCSGQLVPVDPSVLQQLCIGENNGFVSNHYCLSTGPAVFTNTGASQLSCTSLADRPTLLINQHEYKEICGRYINNVPSFNGAQKIF